MTNGVASAQGSHAATSVANSSHSPPRLPSACRMKTDCVASNTAPANQNTAIHRQLMVCADGAAAWSMAAILVQDQARAAPMQRTARWLQRAAFADAIGAPRLGAVTARGALHARRARPVVCADTFAVVRAVHHARPCLRTTGMDRKHRAGIG